MSRSAGEGMRIPSALNACVAIAASSASLASLYAASHARSLVALVGFAFAFSFANNTVFALLHESVHGLLFPSRAANDWCGRLLAVFFPTSLSFHRACHLGHHRRNRTDVELFDYYLPEDSRVLKTVQWYGILTGVYWLVPPVGCIVFLVCPRRLRRALFASRGSEPVAHIGAEAMLEGLDGADARVVRLEVLLSIALQCLFIYALGLSPAGWIACYAAFGFNWSSLQYADHAWSPLDVREGAWNLRVNPLVRYLFLNYHHHLAHHQHPHVPWVHLPRFVDEAAARPRFRSIYLSMWRGPRPAPGRPARRSA